MSISDNLNLLMAKKNLTQQGLAQKIGVSKQAVQFWASGRSEPKGTNLAKLCQFFGVSADWLRDGDGEPQPAGNVHAFTPGDTPPPGFVAIPEYKLSFAAGGPNGEPEWEEINEIEDAWYRETFFHKLGVDWHRCKRFRVVGDSMEPTLYAGDRVLIEEERDPSGATFEDGAIYVINLEGDCRIKRLARIKGGIRVISDNADKYPAEDYVGEEADRIRIYGRVYEVNRRV